MRRILPLLGVALMLPLAACNAPASEEQEQQEQGGEDEDEEGED